MLRIQLTLLCLICFSHLSSQNKQDYYWPFGKDQDTLPEIQASVFDFNKRPFEPEVRMGGLEFDRNNASICDKDGNLLFYTNGCAVANRFHEVMPNGDSINRGLFFETLWRGDCGYGYTGRQDIIILPAPSSNHGFYIFHKPMNYNGSHNTITLDTILYSYVDMDLDEGRGDVLEKNIPILEDTILGNFLTGIAHSQENAWWLLNPDVDNGYHTFLITDGGIEKLPFQDIGPDFHWNASSSGQAYFSPDGTKYALYSETVGLHLYDFDRSSGVLSNFRYLDLKDPENAWFAACEWSPSSQYLYLIQSDSIWQLDTYAEPIEEGLIFIAEHNGVIDPLSTRFFVAALGPDCRIYIRPGSGSNSFLVIHKPDEQGAACDLQQQGIRLPYISATGSFPNFPRFRVDDEEKCDPSIVSILGETVWWRRDLTVYPIPTSGPVTVELPEDHHDGKVYVVDMQGQVVIDKDVQVLVGELQLNLGGLPVGSYSVEYVPRDGKDRTLWTRKVMVVE